MKLLQPSACWQKHGEETTRNEYRGLSMIVFLVSIEHIQDKECLYLVVKRLRGAGFGK